MNMELPSSLVAAMASYVQTHLDCEGMSLASTLVESAPNMSFAVFIANYSDSTENKTRVALFRITDNASVFVKCVDCVHRASWSQALVANDGSIYTYSDDQYGTAWRWISIEGREARGRLLGTIERAQIGSDGVTLTMNLYELRQCISTSDNNVLVKNEVLSLKTVREWKARDAQGLPGDLVPYLPPFHDQREAELYDRLLVDLQSLVTGNAKSSQISVETHYLILATSESLKARKLNRKHLEAALLPVLLDFCRGALRAPAATLPAGVPSMESGLVLHSSVIQAVNGMVQVNTAESEVTFPVNGWIEYSGRYSVLDSKDGLATRSRVLLSAWDRDFSQEDPFVAKDEADWEGGYRESHIDLEDTDALATLLSPFDSPFDVGTECEVSSTEGDQGIGWGLQYHPNDRGLGCELDYCLAPARDVSPGEEWMYTGQELADLFGVKRVAVDAASTKCRFLEIDSIADQRCAKISFVTRIRNTIRKKGKIVRKIQERADGTCWIDLSRGYIRLLKERRSVRCTIARGAKSEGLAIIWHFRTKITRTVGSC